MKDYYTNKQIRTYSIRSLMIAVAALGISVTVAISVIIRPIIRWENNHLKEVWTEYQVMYKDSTRVILYNSENINDSIVIRGAPKLFPGIQAVEILHYELP